MAAARKRIEPDQAVPLALSQRERKLLIEGSVLTPELEGKVRICLAKGGRLAAMLTLDELDDLQGCLAAETNHAENRKARAALDRIFDRAGELMDKYAD